MNEPIIPGIELKRAGTVWRGRCPKHVDNTPSFTVYPDNHFHCYSCNYHGWISELTGQEVVKTREGYKQREKKIWPTLDWTQFTFFSVDHAKRLMDWRGYTLPFIEEMVDGHWLGIFEEQFCFPIYQDGRIVRAHIRKPESGEYKNEWFYYPTVGASVTAFVISQKPNPMFAHIFESQWDMFALMSQLSPFILKHSMFISTRGAANTTKLAGIKFPKQNFIWMQNDDAANRWLEGVVAYLPKSVNHRIITPPTKDANDYLKQGGDLTKLL